MFNKKCAFCLAKYDISCYIWLQKTPHMTWRRILRNMGCDALVLKRIRDLKEKKGFTLVELIVVLVILAVLAALLIPALTGYIDKANQEKIKTKTRMLVMAIQTEVSTAYAAKDWGYDADWVVKPAKNAKNHGELIFKLAEDSDLGTLGAFGGLTPGKARMQATVSKKGTIVSVDYYDGAYNCSYNGVDKTYVAAKGPAPSWVSTLFTGHFITLQSE